MPIDLAFPTEPGRGGGVGLSQQHGTSKGGHEKRRAHTGTTPRKMTLGPPRRERLACRARGGGIPGADRHQDIWMVVCIRVLSVEMVLALAW